MSCKNNKYLTSVIDNSVITRDEIRNKKRVPTNFNETNAICKVRKF